LMEPDRETGPKSAPIALWRKQEQEVHRGARLHPGGSNVWDYFLPLVPTAPIVNSFSSG